jgi:CRP-like cAMP-binding protein
MVKDPALPDRLESTLKLLRSGRWFGGLPRDLQLSIVRAASLRTYRRGAWIVRSGEAPRAMHAVLQGRVRVTARGHEGAETTIFVGTPGFWFGDYAVLARASSIGSVIAETPVLTLSLPVAEFERIVARRPGHFRHFADLLFEHYAIAFRYLGDTNRLAGEQRLETRLLDLARIARHDDANRGPVDLVVSQTELGRMVGVSRQRVSRLLAGLEERGVIEVHFRRIRVLL